MSNAKAYLTQELEARLQALGVSRDTRVAIAVSGGADSMALAFLMADRPLLAALTVNHGLRPEAAQEADFVANAMKARGIAHHTLVWSGDKPRSNIQAAARAARYRLLGEWCQANEVPYLLTAHHQDDQAETLMLRLARGSGVYGLAAMQEASGVPGCGSVALLRPLLDVPKAVLKQYLQDVGSEWIEDPSNTNADFDRVKVRQFLSSPPLEGYAAGRLAATARRLRRSRDALEFYEAEWLARSVTECETGQVWLPVDALVDAPEEIVLRGLASICRYFSGTAHTPRMEKLDRLYRGLCNENFRGQTLYGVLFKRDGARIHACRELAACDVRKVLTGLRVWDNRFEISAKGDTRGLAIGALGEDGWRQAVTKWPELRETSVPHAGRLSQPAVFEALQLRALPVMGYSDLVDVTLHLSRKPLIRSKK
ncbi:tRNA lysidine(34) synthetase TilS [Kordiimonas aestuarii]|uniref:tRNA lysidine(34) synthetase TilS n=1 Tax=Kordiimonas aestuarii TaxID=1005925 RepID=UPI0021D2B704|nr:tRNA lysidine(34) synthetase TilS [Kordiimonas aestuarii]